MRAALFLSLVLGTAPADSGTVKVFILAGQSNMEGKGRMKLAEYQSVAPEFRDFYAHLQKDGKWVVRDDVWINFLDRRGALTVGFGSPGCIGPELEFGLAMGDRFDEPVLLIKTAWGGRSLGRDFLPPSARQPAEDELRAIVEKENANPKRKGDVTLEQVRDRYGRSYREMMGEIRTVLGEMGTRFPALKGRAAEVCGSSGSRGGTISSARRSRTPTRRTSSASSGTSGRICRSRVSRS
jgi:hypothetical protein